MNILIVGGAGYLGGSVTDMLRQTEHNIRVYDLLLYEETYRKQVPFIYGDIRDGKKLNECFAGDTMELCLIFHLLNAMHLVSIFQTAP